ncbi:class I SAM-dependent methyltransferase [Streptomyces hirsutus]|uniref:class I SAM-dependent methyltransferase n=1 Tax=Streptomyces hirsutus TaxID=35620 RepID=UPI0036B70F94
MTCPDDPFPGLPSHEEALSAAAAAEYDRYRPDLPAKAAELLADTIRGLPDPTLLDLGTGTGQVPRALLTALPHLAYIEAVDWSRSMLNQARAALKPVLGDYTLNLAQTSADVYAPLAPLPGEDKWTPDLVTCCRAYHWMSGMDVLVMAHRVAAPQATPAIMGNGSLWTHEADRHLAGARPYPASGDEEFVRDLIRQAKALPPLEWVETHGDFQPLH